MDLFLLFLLAASMVVHKPGLVDCCFPGGRLIRRMPKKEPALVYKQHVPNLPENALTSSGPREGRIRRHDRRFNELVANHNPDIIFKDEELTGADRLMSLRCKEKLDALSMLVTNYWPGIKLRVTDAWDEDGLHPADSLHYEGRAVDVTTSDRDRTKYGMLARLAAQAGFDWVYYEVRSHVHASVKSDTSTRNKRALRCFPENATVLTKSGKRVQMRDLKLGDLVLSLDERLRPSFAAVVTNLHVDRVSTSEFVLVVTSSGAGLTISGDHLLYVVDGSYATNGSIRMKPVFAKDLSSHDRAIVYNENENDFAVERIVRTEPITARGLYAPLTTNGRLVVDDVAVSCFAGVVSEATARAVSAPLRWWRKFSDDYLPSNFAIATFSQLRTRDGIVWYAYALQLLAELLDKLNIVTLLVAS